MSREPDGALLERVKKIVAETFHVPAAGLNEKSSRTTVPGWSSLAMLQLSVDLETELGVSFSVDEAAELTSIEAILKILRSKGLT